MSFSEFMTGYYRERLQFYEHLDLGCCTNAELIEVGGEASSLKKFLSDILEEGYEETVSRLVTQTDAINRLQRFLPMVLQRLGTLHEQERFYLWPDRIRLDSHDFEASAEGKSIELHAYLAYLDVQSDCPVDITPCFDEVHQMRRWQAKTQVLMAEMCAFLTWVLKCLVQRQHFVPVPLLRDTLLVQMGLRLLRRHGVSMWEPQPVFIGRAFADQFGDGRQIHGTLANVIYRVLLEHGPCDLATMRRRFAEYVRQEPAIPTAFTQASRAYLEALALEGPPLFIESGVQGTFPLWLLALSGDAGDMVFYVTAPWLYRTYASIVFSKNYNHLREVETIVAHDHLFRLKEAHEGRVFVEETMNEITRRLALYELHAFKEIVKSRMGEMM
jgi:hypothetical protein